MSLSISCHLDRLDYLDDIIKTYNTGIEINDFANPKILNDDQLLSETKQKYTEYFNENNITRTLHGPFFDLIIHATDNAFMKLSVEKIKKAIEICNELNCKKIVFHTGYMPVLKSRNYEKIVTEKQVKFWTSVCKENGNLIICLENMFEKTPELICEIIEKSMMPNLCFCLDVAHCLVFSRKSIKFWIDKTGKYLSHVHLSDSRKTSDQHLALGTGKVKLNKAMKILKNVNNDLSCVIEVSGEDMVKKSIRYLIDNGFLNK